MMTPKNDARIVIVPYDPAWPARFEAERVLLTARLAPWLVSSIEHVGSTAVPGLAAKPVIDIMAPVESLKASVGAKSVAAELGYLYHAYGSDRMHWFCRPSPEFRTHHLHLVPFRSRLWKERIRFRDALRVDAGLAREYEAVKRSLAERHGADREAYTRAKSEFVRRVLDG